MERRSPWTHGICRPCWYKIYPERPPITLSNPDVEICCFCQETTDMRIYIRYPPNQLRCKGKHDMQYILSYAKAKATRIIELEGLTKDTSPIGRALAAEVAAQLYSWLSSVASLPVTPGDGASGQGDVTRGR